MGKVFFSSDEFPAELDDDARLAHWRDIHDGIYCGIDLYRADDRPFSMRFDFGQFGGVSVGRFEGTVRRMVRRREAVAHDSNDDFSFGVNCGGAPLAVIRPDAEVLLDHGSAILTSNDDVGDVRGGVENAWFAVNIPRRNIRDLVANADGLLGVSLDPQSEALRHIRRYLDMLINTDTAIESPSLAHHVGTTLTDLVALALGAAGEGAEISRMRGLRAARLQQILAAINQGFLAADFSSRRIAATLGFSARYIQDLLHETGTGFAERVAELRLQHARRMLADRRYDALKVIDIVYASGFSDVSYFNRQFRRRFGASPSDFRLRGK
jgi:AraC-like DNA-binding protein